MKRKYETRVTSYESQKSIGSALILAVVLTSLLAIVGVMFLMTARMDRMATSAVAQKKELDLAIDTVIAKISGELALDVPFIDDANGVERSEYHDYPGPEDRWLASMEPYQAGGVYYWPQISDITNMGWRTRNILLTDGGTTPPLFRAVIRDHKPIALDVDDGSLLEQLADADGDGIADSKWFILEGITSGRGEPIYVAVRIIDNCGMLNVNTAYKFEPNEPVWCIDGSSQMQVNLAWLSQRGVSNGSLDTAANKLQAWRCGAMPTDLALYERNVIWRYGTSDGPYIPFDISDELKLRNRYILNYNRITTRIEELWTKAYDGGLEVPRTDPCEISDPTNPNFWFWRTNYNWRDPNDYDKYDFRHISTTCSMDRILNPVGPTLNNCKMVNVNTADPNVLRDAITEGLLDAGVAPGIVDANAAQIAVNIKDYRDGDDFVTSFAWPPGGKVYYGFERPCIYISELDYNQVTITSGSPPTVTTYKSYAVELYKPYTEDLLLMGDWQVVVDGNSVITIDSSLPGKNFYILRNQVPEAALLLDLTNGVSKDSPSLVFAGGSNIELQRKVTDPNGTSKYITVDSILAPGWLVSGDGRRSFRRDINKHKCIRGLWDPNPSSPTLGSVNTYTDPDEELVQAHPYLDPVIYTDRFTGRVGFKNIGEIGMVLAQSGYDVPSNNMRPADLLIDFRNPKYAKILNYLTVMDPAAHKNPSSETRVKGRININTAPWFVIAQLPWMRYNEGVDEYSRAKAVAQYRDSVGGFSGIAELMQVPDVRNLGADGMDNLNSDIPKGPDLTNDTARDDFEERDVIFSRLSNLVTVRSDVFTAYILVRIGADGPQKRVIAILDRSGVSPIDGYPYTTGRVKVRALHPVPDPW